MTTLPELVVETAEPLGAALAMGIKLAADKESTDAELARRIPRIVAAMLDAGVLEPTQKVAMASSLRNPVNVVQVLENLLAQIQAGDVKKASDGNPPLGRPFGATQSSAPLGKQPGGNYGSDQAFLTGLGLDHVANLA
jgi:hypothetical protein